MGPGLGQAGARLWPGSGSGSLASTFIYSLLQESHIIPTMATALYIESNKSSLPTRTPNLMPFHIAYSGSAPISTYFRVKPAPPPTYGSHSELEKNQATVLPDENVDSQTTADSQETVVAETPTLPSAASTSSTLPVLSTATSSDTLVNEVGRAAEGLSQVSLQRHYSAAFRGREMRGLQVDLPEGYRGAVLRIPDVHETESSSKVERNRKRGKKQQSLSQEEEDMDMLDGDDAEELRRVIRPIATFPSFVLWNPDIPVDEGHDEYLRSLHEWTRISAEVRGLGRLEHEKAV